MPRGRGGGDRQPKRKAENETPLGRYFLGRCFGLARKYGGSLIRWGFFTFCVHDVSKAISAFAGRTSIESFGLGLLANVQIVWTLSIAVSGISIALYLHERKAHRRTRERLTARIIELETKIDPNRTSSLLTTEGLTRREDE